MKEIQVTKTRHKHPFLKQDVAYYIMQMGTTPSYLLNYGKRVHLCLKYTPIPVQPSVKSQVWKYSEVHNFSLTEARKETQANAFH